MTRANSAIYNGIMSKASFDDKRTLGLGWKRRGAYSPKELNYRHVAIMAELLANPHLTHNEVAERMGYGKDHFSVLVTSDLFQLAFKQYQREHQKKISDLVADATTSALKFSMNVVDGQIVKSEIPVEVRQDSAKDILNLGHAKAIEKSASLTGHFELPKEFLGGIQAILNEVVKPFEPTRTLQLPGNGSGEKEKDEDKELGLEV